MSHAHTRLQTRIHDGVQRISIHADCLYRRPSVTPLALKIQQHREKELLKIQQERERTYSKSSKREREDLFKIQQEREKAKEVKQASKQASKVLGKGLVGSACCVVFVPTIRDYGATGGFGSCTGVRELV